MELPQSRPFGTAQAKKATHDFLSLYTRSSLQQDPRPSSHGGFLKTQNFFVSLGEEKNGPNEDKSENIDIEKPPLAVSCPSVVEHQLPGGFGAYNISHMAYSNQRVAKSEEDFIAVAQITNNDGNDENSNCDSYTGNGFILWHESATGKGSTRNELSRSENVLRESRIKVGQWPLDQPSQSSSNRRSSVSPLSSLGHGQKNQSFTDMIKSAKGPGSMAEDEEELNLIKENSSSQKGELRVKVDGKSSDQKANTPRSKHSATEQRRRCKINDRFQMLRELIPHGDQKRDKASFLLEVTEYIQFLQEKVSRYEGPYSKWNCEPAKITPWRNGHGPAESLINQSRVSNGVTGPVLMFGTRHDEKPTNALSNIQRNPQIPAESVVTNAINFNAVDQQSGMTKKAGSISSALLPDVYAPVRQNGAGHPSTTRLPSDGENGSLAHLHLLQNGNSASEPTSTDKLKDQELTLESGTISISSIYSQGLLNTLTQAFQSSGVDLSHANISVEVDVGKRANNHQNTQKPIKVAEVPSSTQSLLRARVESNIEESDHAVKRLKAT